MQSDNNILSPWVIGRVEPHIYAFTTQTIPNYLKVGETHRPVADRIAEWEKRYERLKHVYQRSARIDDNTIFRDLQVHEFLVNEKHRHRLTEDDIDPDVYFSREFFKDATPEDVDEAIEDIHLSARNSDGRYKLYTPDRLPIEENYRRGPELTPRANQREVIDRFKRAVNDGRTNLLMYAVMRFGKTFTALCCAKEIDASLVLVVTAKPEVREEWKRAVQSHGNFAGYIFADKNSLKSSATFLADKLHEGNKIVLFLSLQDLQGDEMKLSHKEVFETEWDLLIVDETHFGAQAAEFGKVLQDTASDSTEEERQMEGEETIGNLDGHLKHLRRRITLHLSGTPYRILMRGNFEDEDIVGFVRYSDIASAQKAWDTANSEKAEDERREDWENPYFGFPQMLRFAFLPNEASLLRIKELESRGGTASFSELFRPESLDPTERRHKTFRHKDVVLDFLKSIDGSHHDGNVLGFLDNELIKKGKLCSHIVMVLPYCASCDAMENLITSHKDEFLNLGEYEIINISSANTAKRPQNPEAIRRRIEKAEKEGRKTLTLTVRRMLTGNTVPEWDTMLYLKQTSSPEEYDQAIFRLQNPYVARYSDGGEIIPVNKKPQTILVDFHPDRLFEMQEKKCLIYYGDSAKKGNAGLEERIARELSFSPVITLNHDRLQEVNATDIINHIMNYAATRSVAEEALDLPVDLSLLGYKGLNKIISALSPLNAAKGIFAKAHEGKKDSKGSDTEPTESDGDKKTDKEKGKEKGKDAKESEEQKLAKKFATYYSLILLFAFLTEDKVTTLYDILRVLCKTKYNRRISAALSLEKNTLRLLAQHIRPSLLSQLDYRIAKINKLVNDSAKSPQEKAETALKKFGRMSASEVVTPQHVADEMVGALPDDLFERGPVLDIASKQGEFALALLRRYETKAHGKVYAICTSPVAYEFTRKIYKMVGEPVGNIFEEFDTYDLIKKDNENIIDTLKAMNFAATIGNPPYHENDGSGASDDAANPIYQCFVTAGKRIHSELLSLIMPSKWMTGGKIILRQFRKEMMEDNSISVLVDYEDSARCFNNQHIDGGICYFIRDSRHNGDVHYTFITNKNEKISSTRKLNDGESDIVIRDIRRNSIIAKVMSGSDEFKEIVSMTRPFGIRKDLFNSPERYPGSNLSETPFANSVKIYGVKGIKGGARRREGYISKDIVTRGSETINKYKLFFTTSYSTNAINPPESIIGNPGEICTETFLSIGPFDTQEEQLNCKKYFETNFFKILLYFGKGTMQVSKEVFRFVPMQDFTAESDIHWDRSVEEIDKELIEKYHLQDEKDFIDSMIKPMK